MQGRIYMIMACIPLAFGRKVIMTGVWEVQGKYRVQGIWLRVPGQVST